MAGNESQQRESQESKENQLKVDTGVFGQYLKVSGKTDKFGSEATSIYQGQEKSSSLGETFERSVDQLTRWFIEQESDQIKNTQTVEKEPSDAPPDDIKTCQHQEPRFDLNNAEDYSHRDFIYYRQGNYDQAIANYNQAIQLQPDYAEAFSNRGQAYTRKGDYDQAIVDYDQAIELEPNKPWHYYARAYTFLHIYDFDRARADFEKALNLTGDDYPELRERIQGELEWLRADQVEVDLNQFQYLKDKRERNGDLINKTGIPNYKNALEEDTKRIDRELAGLAEQLSSYDPDHLQDEAFAETRERLNKWQQEYKEAESTNFGFVEPDETEVDEVLLGIAEPGVHEESDSEVSKADTTSPPSGFPPSPPNNKQPKPLPENEEPQGALIWCSEEELNEAQQALEEAREGLSDSERIGVTKEFLTTQVHELSPPQFALWFETRGDVWGHGTKWGNRAVTQWLDESLEHQKRFYQAFQPRTTYIKNELEIISELKHKDLQLAIELTEDLFASLEEKAERFPQLWRRSLKKVKEVKLELEQTRAAQTGNDGS